VSGFGIWIKPNRSRKETRGNWREKLSEERMEEEEGEEV
jgi:hypothetical protein